MSQKVGNLGRVKLAARPCRSSGSNFSDQRLPFHTTPPYPCPQGAIHGEQYNTCIQPRHSILAHYQLVANQLLLLPNGQNTC